MECQKASSLRVRGYTSTHVIDLPPTYTRDAIPLDREHIPTCETAKKWDHFKSITVEIPHLLNIDIGLLIGYNCSNALVPREVIAGKSTEPYAVKTDLGWSIVGSMSPSSVSETTGFCYRVSAREVPMMNPTNALSLLQSNFKDTNQNDKSACISQDDIQFSEILEKGIHTNELSHLEIPLPCASTEWKPLPGVKTNLMGGGPEMKGKTVGETEIKGKMMGETEIKSKNEKVDQTAQVIEIKDFCVVLQDKAHCTSESLSKEKTDTEVTETVKVQNKTDTQEDRKTKAQTWYKGEASSIVTTDIPIDFVSDDVRVHSEDKLSKESRTQKAHSLFATRPTPIPPLRRKSRSPKKRHASKPPGSTSSARLSSVRTSPGNRPIKAIHPSPKQVIMTKQTRSMVTSTSSKCSPRPTSLDLHKVYDLMKQPSTEDLLPVTPPRTPRTRRKKKRKKLKPQLQ